MKFTKRLVILVSVIIPFVASAQDYPITPYPSPQPLNNQSVPGDFQSLKERVFVGGSVSGWFGSTTYINLSPVVGFKINKKVSAGVGGTYNYYSQSYGGQKFASTVYGSSVFARYMITDNFFGQVEWDRLSVPDFTSPIANDRAWVHNLLVGGGYKQLFTEHASFVAMIFYNVNQTPLSPYTNPIIQIGFNINLY